MLPMRLELIISSLQDWCLTTMALEAQNYGNLELDDVLEPELCHLKTHRILLTYIRIKNINKYGCRKSNPGLLLGRQVFYH